MLSFDMPRTFFLFTLLATAAATSTAQWTLHDAHTTADLRGIDNVGHGVAWASGTDGTILRTEDAGIVWQLCAKPPAGEHLDFRAIQAFDNNTAIIMSSGKGDLSRLYKTTDGCQTWTPPLHQPRPRRLLGRLPIRAFSEPGGPSFDAAEGWDIARGSARVGSPRGLAARRPGRWTLRQSSRHMTEGFTGTSERHRL